MKPKFHSHRVVSDFNLQVWMPVDDVDTEISKKLHIIAKGGALQRSIETLSREYGVDFVCFSKKLKDEDSTESGIDILYMIRGKRSREHTPEFESELLELLNLNQAEAKAASIAELRAGRANYTHFQGQLKATHTLVASIGTPIYAEARHGR